MKLNLKTYTTTFTFKVICCKKGEVKITKQQYGRCWSKYNFKCKVCDKRAKLKMWNYKPYTPCLEEKKIGFKREVAHTDYDFEVYK